MHSLKIRDISDERISACFPALSSIFGNNLDRCKEDFKQHSLHIFAEYSK